MARLVVLAPLVFIFLLSPHSARAEDRARLAALAGTGTEVYVTCLDGVERRGRVAGVADAGLRLSFAGRVTAVPWEDIVTVDRRGDPVMDGALKGAGIAVALYGALALLADDDGGANRLALVGSAALTWGAVGAVTDALNIGRARVYVRPAGTSAWRASEPNDGAAHSPGRPGVVAGVTFVF